MVLDTRRGITILVKDLELLYGYFQGLLVLNCVALSIVILSYRDIVLLELYFLKRHFFFLFGYCYSNDPMQKFHLKGAALFRREKDDIV